MYYQFFNVELKSYSWFDWGLLYPADIVEKYTNVMIRLKDLELTPEVTSRRSLLHIKGRTILIFSWIAHELKHSLSIIIVG